MKSRSHRLPTISDTPDDWVDESWTVDCVCGVNFDDGEEMVDCDECGVWVHTRCSRYVKSEKLFSCDKCKSKKLRKESEETEVAQLLVELPTKTLRMDNPYPINCPQSSFQVWTEIPLEEKVHVQGIPGGDPSLFNGVSSVFSQQLWKCTGYVPKKFNSQYREFPCWDERQDDDNKEKEESEKNHDSKGADALFSLSTSGGNKSQVNEGGVLDMGPPSSDVKKQDVRKEKSVVIHSGNQKKDESKMAKDQNKKKNVKDKGDSKKQDLQSFESDAKQSESNEGKGHKVSKIDKQNLKPENSRMDVKENHKSDDNNTPLSSGQPSENLPIDDSRLSPSKEAKQMEENDGNKLSTTSVEISVKKEDEMASSIKQNPIETSTNKDEVVNNVVTEVNENGGNCSTSNGSQPNLTNSEKTDVTPNVNLQRIPSPPIEVKPQETNNPEKTSNPQNTPTSDPKLDTSQDTKASNNRSSPITEDKKESLSEIPLKSQSQRKITGKPSSKSRHSTTEDRTSSGKQKVVTNETNKIKKDNSSKDVSKSSKSTHLTKSTSHVSKKNSSDSKDSGDSASSLRCETGEKEQNNKSTLESSQKGEKVIKHVTKNLSDEELALLLHQELNSSPRVPRVPRMRHAGSLPQLASSTPGTSSLMKRTSSSGGKDNGGPRKRQKEFDKKGERGVAVVQRRHESGKNGSANKSVPPVSSAPSSSNEGNDGNNNNNMLSPINGSDDEVPTHRTLPGLIAEIMSKGKRMAYEELCNAVLPHWPNLRKHNGERYAYSSHSQAVLDCLRNRSEWARLVDRGPKTNAGRKRRKSEVDAPNIESEEDDDYGTDKNTKDENNKNSGEEFPKGKRKARKHRRLAMQGTRGKDVVRRRRRKAEVVSDENEEDDDDSDEDSEESEFSEEGGRTSVANEASASSDETGTMS